MTERQIRCANCGATWSPPADIRPDYPTTELVCPVCRMRVAESEAVTLRVGSISDLEVQLDLLVRGAWESGLDSEAIVQVLRDEISFAAELGQVGRRIAVLLVDLGPQERELLQRPIRDRRELLLNRRGNNS